MDNYGTLNEVLVNLFNDIMDIEQKAIITPESVSYTHLRSLCKVKGSRSKENRTFKCQRSISL